MAKAVHVLCVMGPSGHERHEWDPETGEGVPEAAAAFASSQKKGMLMVERAGGETEYTRVTSFDPKAKDLLAMPPLAGG
jgi:hypothetical protein